MLEHVLVVAIRSAGTDGAYFGIVPRCPRPNRRLACISALMATLVLVGAACGSSDSDDPTPPTGTATTSVVDGPAPAVYSNPQQPITVTLGQEFDIALPADPRSGLSWQAVAPPNPIVLLSIGSSFRPAGAHGQVLQVLHYGARGPGITAVPLRYASPKPGARVLDTKTFAVTVIDPNAPPPPPPPPPPPTTAAPVTGRGRTTTGSTPAG